MCGTHHHCPPCPPPTPTPGVQTRQAHTRRAAHSTALDRLDRLATPLALCDPAHPSRGASPPVAAQVTALATAFQEEVLPAYSAAAEATQLEDGMRVALRAFIAQDGIGERTQGTLVPVERHRIVALADAALWRTKGVELLAALCAGPEAAEVLLQGGAVEELFASNLRGEGGETGQRLLVHLVRVMHLSGRDVEGCLSVVAAFAHAIDLWFCSVCECFHAIDSCLCRVCEYLPLCH